MQQEAPDELVGIKGHYALARVVAIVLPAKPDLAMVDAEQAVVGNRDAMSVAAEIVEYLLRATKWRLRVDHPFILLSASQVFGKCTRIGQWRQSGKEL